jgi:hypothetical protein
MPTKVRGRSLTAVNKKLAELASLDLMIFAPLSFAVRPAVLFVFELDQH